MGNQHKKTQVDQTVAPSTWDPILVNKNGKPLPTQFYVLDNIALVAHLNWASVLVKDYDAYL